MRGRLLSNMIEARKVFFKFLKPCAFRTVTYSYTKQVTKFSTSCKKYYNNQNASSKSHNLYDSIQSAETIGKDEDAEAIIDIDDRKETIDLDDLKTEEEYHNPYEGINLERGETGVFDIDELVTLLRKDNAKNIFVASVPSELSYIDYIVVVTSRSKKHMQTLATFVRKVYKLKKHEADFIPKIEGRNSNSWIALDLGNIALHIFSQSARTFYDLETLWSVGPDYDDKSKITTEDIMDQYHEFLSELEPMESRQENETLSKKM